LVADILDAMPSATIFCTTGKLFGSILVKAIGWATTGALTGASPTIFMLKPTGIPFVDFIAFINIISSKSFMDFDFKFINIEMIWNNSQIYRILSEYGYKQVGASFSSYSGWFLNEF
jgi:hypothetical protein